MKYHGFYSTLICACLLLLCGCVSPPATPTSEGRTSPSPRTLPRATSVQTRIPPGDTGASQGVTSTAPRKEDASAIPTPPAAATATLAATTRVAPAQPNALPTPTPIAVAATKLGSVSDPIEHILISPDNRFMIYLEGKILYSRPLAGGRPRQIASNVEPGQSALFRVSSDSRWITYNDAGAFYRTPIEGGQVVRLTNERAYINYPLKFMQDGRSFVGCEIAGENNILYRADLDGRPPVQLHKGSESFLCDFELTPDSRYVIQRISVRNDDRPHVPSWPGIAFIGLYSVSLADGGVTQLNGPLPAANDISDYRISPDGSTVFYIAGGQLYRVPTIGGTPLLIGPATSIADFSPDAQHLIYQNADGLYNLLMGGGAPIQLTSAADTRLLSDPQISLDSRFVVYHISEQPASNSPSTAIDAVPLTGGAPAKLVDSPAFLDRGYFLLSPDRRSVIAIEQHADGTYILLSISLATGQRVQLGQFVAGGLPMDCTFLPNGRSILYRQTDGGLIDGLFAVPLEGGTVQKLSPEGASVRVYTLSQDGRQIVYIADPAPFDDSPLDVYTLNTSAFAP